jgi:hypothetical protein
LFGILKNEMVAMGKRICIPNDRALKEEILNGAHESRLTIHPGSTKMYRDLKENY